MSPCDYSINKQFLQLLFIQDIAGSVYSDGVVDAGASDSDTLETPDGM